MLVVANLCSAVQTIATTSSILSCYAVASGPHDARYNASLVLLIIACLGVILSLLAYMYQGSFSDSILFAIFVYLMIGSNITGMVMANILIPNHTLGFVVGYVIVAILLIVGVWGTFGNNAVAPPSSV